MAIEDDGIGGAPSRHQNSFWDKFKFPLPLFFHYFIIESDDEGKKEGKKSHESHLDNSSREKKEEKEKNFKSNEGKIQGFFLIFINGMWMWMWILDDAFKIHMIIIGGNEKEL